MTAPIWKMPTREQAVDVLVSARAQIEQLVHDLSDKQMKTPTLLGGGLWSVKDLLGHLASCEVVALAVATGRELPRRARDFESVDERNAFDIDRKRSWTLGRVRKELDQTRTQLLAAIEEMGDEGWTTKIPLAGGKTSARGLVIGKIMVGGKHGLFAHDLAHLKDLEKSVRALNG